MTSKAAILSDIPVDKLVRGRFQPRQRFDQQQLQELSEAIKTAGLLQPIIVRQISDHYEIIAGERRWLASQMAGLKVVSCLIRDFNDEQALEAAIIENVSRTDLNPIEEANAYLRLMNEFGYIHEEIALALGKSRSKITNSLRMLKLEPLVQNYLIEGFLSEGHGKILAGLPKEAQNVLAQKCVKHSWSVRRLEQEVKSWLNPATRKGSPIDPNIRALEQALSDHVGCAVNIDFAKENGTLHIDFHNLDILEGLLQKLGFKLNV